MSEKKIEEFKELSEEQLEDVSGGKDMAKYLPANHGPHIGMYDAEHYIGKKVYAVYDSDRENYLFGTLVRSWEENCYGFIVPCTVRKHTIYVEGDSGYWRCHYDFNKNLDILGDDYTLFLYTN